MRNIKILSNILLYCIIPITLIKYYKFYPILFIILLILILRDWLIISKHNKEICYFGFVYIIPFYSWLPILYLRNYEILWIFTICWSYDLFSYIGTKLFKNKKYFDVIIGFIMSCIISYIYIYYLLQHYMWNSFVHHIVVTPFLIISTILGKFIYSKVRKVLNKQKSILYDSFILDRFDGFILTMHIHTVYIFISSHFGGYKM